MTYELEFTKAGRLMLLEKLNAILKTNSLIDYM